MALLTPLYNNSNTDPTILATHTHLFAQSVSGEPDGDKSLSLMNNQPLFTQLLIAQYIAKGINLWLAI